MILFFNCNPFKIIWRQVPETGACTSSDTLETVGIFEEGLYLLPRKIPICYGSDYNEDIISKETGFPLEAT
jgi:hypothetical protein